MDGRAYSQGTVGHWILVLIVRVLSSSLLACAHVALGGPVSAGLRAGLPLNQALHAESPWYRRLSTPYVLGPAIELELAGPLALEVDALHRRLGYQWPAQGNSASGPTFTARSSRWEIPCLIKYRWRSLLGPFLAAGVAWNRVTEPAISPAGSSTPSRPPEFRHRQALGLVMGAGLELRLGRVRLGPELRYTHWGERNFGTRTSSLHSVLDQADLLVGISF